MPIGKQIASALLVLAYITHRSQSAQCKMTIFLPHIPVFVLLELDPEGHTAAYERAYNRAPNLICSERIYISYQKCRLATTGSFALIVRS